MNAAYEASRECMTEEESLVFLHMIESMRNQGVGLPPSDRVYLELQREEALISFELSDNTVLKHLPVTSIYGRRLPHNSAVYSYILRTSPDENVRRIVWEAQSQCNPDVLDKLLRLRHIRNSIACTRGFRNYAECAQRECIMNTPESVDAFLNKCASSLESDVLAELRELRDLKRSMGSNDVSLNPWDLDYLIGSERGKLSVEFSVRSVLDYFEKLLDQLFGIKLVRDTAEPLWHPLVAKFILVRRSGPHVNGGSFVESSSPDPCNYVGATDCDSSGDVEIAHLYMDLFSREGKTNVCAQFTVRCSKLLEPIYNGAFSSAPCVPGSVSPAHVSIRSPDGSLRQIPATTIVCSFPIEGTRTDILEALNESYIDVMAAQTLFHELGHTVHALCSRTNLQHLSGNRGGVDFAEFSSHLFELYFVEGLSDICKSAGLDTASAERASTLLRKYRAIDTARMALMAKLDLAFYNSCEELHSRNVPDLINSVRLFGDKFDCSDISVLLGLPALTNFDHLLHYGGTYFCYLYSRYVPLSVINLFVTLNFRVLAIKIWRSFEGKPRSSCTGEKLYGFFMKGSTDASLAPLNLLAGRDLALMKDDLFLD
ncbi:peptidase family M3 containing protein [Babesia divergens]|uniref:Peptidase family M3 containing protein n=1 Tax=Babesia divergens TaxID=32595 RepID=A0AAD9G6W9_BABDI|nr:peptidase family M3 containing protein [Babesia divergens]